MQELKHGENKRKERNVLKMTTGRVMQYWGKSVKNVFRIENRTGIKDRKEITERDTIVRFEAKRNKKPKILFEKTFYFCGWGHVFYWKLK